MRFCNCDDPPEVCINISIVSALIASVLCITWECVCVISCGCVWLIEWVQVVQGADWLILPRRSLKADYSQFLRAPLSPLSSLRPTACVCFLNKKKTLFNKVLLLVVYQGWEEGSLIYMLHPRNGEALTSRLQSAVRNAQFRSFPCQLSIITVIS